jgi:hypothetical protein
MTDYTASLTPGTDEYMKMREIDEEADFSGATEGDR